MHTVEKEVVTRDHNDQPMTVKVKKEEVDWKPILGLYVEKYGKKPKEEARKRKHGDVGTAAEAEADGAEAEEPSSEDDSSSDNGSDAAGGNGGGGKGPPEVRQTRAQTKQVDREERHKEAEKSMPTAMVCIAFKKTSSSLMVCKRHS